MSNSKSPPDRAPAPAFPYDHLAVLGFRKLQRYVPPSKRAAVEGEAERETPSAPPSAAVDSAKPARH